MKCIIEKSQLITSLSMVSKGMSSRSTLPILSGIYIEATGGKLVFQTTDLEITIKTSTQALVEKEGMTVVPGKLFLDIIKSFSEAAITLELINTTLNISCLESTFTINTLDPADFPTFPDIVTNKTVSLPTDSLASMIKRVSKAVSRDESRAVLTGILFKVKSNTLQLVATDSYRLAVVKKELEDFLSDDFELIVPGSVFDEISRLSINEKELIIKDSDNQIVFSFGETIFITRKIEGNYPNYEQIIPSQKALTAIIETDTLLAAVKRAAILAQSHTPIRLSFSTITQTIEISSSTQDVGGANEKISAQIEGEDLEIGFNHQYILDGLVSIQNEELLFEAQTALKPGIIKSVSDDSFFYLTMPVRLDR